MGTPMTFLVPKNLFGSLGGHWEHDKEQNRDCSEPKRHQLYIYI